MDAADKIARGVALFNARKFFQAHEAWEELWLAEKGSERAFLQGLIQCAAAFHHYSRGNLRGTKSLLARGLANLARFPRHYCSLDVASLRNGAGPWLRWLDGKQEAAAPPLPAISTLSRRGCSKDSTKSAARKRTGKPCTTRS